MTSIKVQRNDGRLVHIHCASCGEKWRDDDTVPVYELFIVNGDVACLRCGTSTTV